MRTVLYRIPVFRNQSGSGLIQTIIGAGIMGVLMLGFMAMTTHQSRETRSLREVLASMDLQKTLTAVLADGTVCHHVLNGSTPRTFDSTVVSATRPQTIKVNQIPISASAGAPALVEAGLKASSYSDSLRVSSIRLDIRGGSGSTYIGDWVVEFDSSKTTRQVRPVSVSTTLLVDKTNPKAARITGCQSGAGEKSGIGELECISGSYSDHKDLSSGQNLVPDREKRIWDSNLGKRYDFDSVFMAEIVESSNGHAAVLVCRSPWVRTGCGAATYNVSSTPRGWDIKMNGIDKCTSDAEGEQRVYATCCRMVSSN